MEKPSDALMRLYELEYIVSITVHYRQTGTDTADTFVDILGWKGKKIKEHPWTIYKEYLEVQMEYNSIAHIKDRYTKQILEWIAFEKRNKKDLSEYRRLKKKFEPDKT